MKTTLLIFGVSIMILTLIGCDSEETINSESNIIKVKEAYKTIVVPIVQASDLQ